MAAVTRLWLPTHPHYPYSPPTHPPLLHATCDNAVAVKQVDITLSKNQVLQILHLV